jgi:prevent-host-death family protein
MTTVNVATLKGRLSHYLGLVKRGEEVVVTSHRHPVARILPPTTPATLISEPTRPVADVLKLKGVKRRRSVSAVNVLLKDRRGR